MSNYPESHNLAIERTLWVIDIMGSRADITDEEIVLELVTSGVNAVDAELLVRFVPCGFAFAFLKLMGVSRFPSSYQVYGSDGKLVDFPLASEHYFTAALGIGHDITTGGYTERINKAVFMAITSRSAELDAINQFLHAGHTKEEIEGSALSSPIFLGITAEQITLSRGKVVLGSTE